MLKTFEDFYVKKDYQNALLTLEKQGSSLPKDMLQYNLGTVHSKLGHWAQARYHFLLAEEAGFSENSLVQNLDAVEEKLEITRLEQPLEPQDYAVKAALFAKDGVLTSIALLILITGLVLLKKRASLWKIAAWIVGIALPLALSFWINTWPRFIALEPQVIAEGPSAIFRESGELPAGVTVIATGEGEWRRILWPSRFSGWIRIQALKELE